MSDDFIPGTKATIRIDTVAIGDLEKIGDFGGSTTVIKHEPLDGEIYKKTGSKDSGTLALSGAFVPSDAGQVALKAAYDSRTTNAYVIELNNSLGTNGTQFAFNSVVTAFTIGVSGPNDKVTLSATLEISGAITVTAAA